MALRNFASMAHDEDDAHDMRQTFGEDYQPPDYPGRLQFHLSEGDLAKLGGDMASIGASTRFSAMGEVTSIFRDMNDSRIELEVTEFAGEDGQFFDLEHPATICLCEREMRKMDLDDDAERGDTIHLIGTARIENTSSTLFGGDMVTLQVTELTFAEDESQESREG